VKRVIEIRETSSSVTRMIFVRTPFRLPLGGGSTDLPSYYRGYGGFIFGVAINLYFDTFLRKPRIDNNVRFQYSGHDEIVDLASKLPHDIGRAALQIANIGGGVHVTFQSDTPAGTGLGSSGSCAVGLLHALFRLKGERPTRLELAERAFEVTQLLGWPDGKQDPYISALGGFVAFDIERTGKAIFHSTGGIAPETIERFLRRTLLFYTGIRRDSKPILDKQEEKRIIDLKHRTLAIGREIFGAFNNLDSDGMDYFGMLMDEHWRIKRGMSPEMSSSEFDELYTCAKQNGALGGKILGAGGGGYFMFCVKDGCQEKLKSILTAKGLHHVPFKIDSFGTRVAFEE